MEQNNLNIQEGNKYLELIGSAIEKLWLSRVLIIKFISCCFILSIVIVFLLPKYYKSTVILVPDTEKSKIVGIGGISNIAALAGYGIGQVPVEQLYPEIIVSERILREVIYKKYRTSQFDYDVNLIEYWGFDDDDQTKNFENALEKLSSELDSRTDRKTNIVTITFMEKEPKLAADILNQVATSLDSYMRNSRISNAQEQRKWIESRVREVKFLLTQSEENLKKFRQTNRSIANSPELILEEQRRIRDVQINTEILIELTKQLELAKIEEVKNISIINVLDPARPAGKKEKPKRIFIVANLMLFSILGIVLYILQYEKLVSVKREVKKMFANLKTE